MAFFGLMPMWDRHPAAVIDGTLHPDFIPVADALRRQLQSYPGGAAVCVYHRGECVVDLWCGVADRGLLNYDDRVAAYWPEFARAGKDTITVRHVLSHQSGLYHIRQMIDRA